MIKLEVTTSNQELCSLLQYIEGLSGLNHAQRLELLDMAKTWLTTIEQLGTQPLTTTYLSSPKPAAT